MKIESDGKNFLFYEDSCCCIKISVEDFRNTTWWLAIVDDCDANQNKIIVNKVQKEELYRRISVRFGVRVFDDIIGTVEPQSSEININKSIID